MKRILILLCCSIGMLTNSMAQKTDHKLTKLLIKEIANFQGDIGIYVQHLKTNKTVAIAADSIFPTASIVKVPILVGIFKQIQQGKLHLNDKFTYDAKRTYGGSGLMQFFKDSTQTDLSTLISLMLTYSDNVASIWCQELAGGGQTINSIMGELGLVQTKVNSRTPGREAIWEVNGWGQTSPKEMALLLTRIRQGKLFDAKHDEKMYRYLKNQFYNERSLAQIPAHIATASKTGSVDDARGEVVLVNAPHGDYVFTVLTKNNKDQSWTNNNEAEVLTRKIAQILWNYYEPKEKYFAPASIQ